MNIKTKNPVVVDDQNMSPNDYYANAQGDVDVNLDYLPIEEVSAGDIKVLTKYPVVLDGSEVSPRDYYSNAAGVPLLTTEQLAALEAMSKKTGKEPSKEEKRAAKQKGVFWDNLRKSWQSFTQSEVGKMTVAQIDAALTARREARFGAGQGGAFLPDEMGGGLQTEQTGQMSTTTKVLLIGGGLVVAGLIIYAVVKGNSK